MNKINFMTSLDATVFDSISALVEYVNAHVSASSGVPVRVPFIRFVDGVLDSTMNNCFVSVLPSADEA